MSDVTAILSAIEKGDPIAAEQLLPLVYEELRKLAAQKLAQEKPGQTLQATALVHEAYLRLVDADAAAAVGRPRALLRRRRRGHAPHPRRSRPREGPREAGRQAREDRHRRHRPGHHRHARTSSWPSMRRWRSWPSSDAVAAKLVELRYFAGLTVDEAGEGPGRLHRHRLPALELRPRLAVRRAARVFRTLARPDFSLDFPPS